MADVDGRRARAIAGDALHVGDVFLSKVDRRMQVERITLMTRPGYVMRPLLIAHGPTELESGHIAKDWQEPYFGDDWVVVER